MSDLAIRVENLSKQYCIGKHERYYALRDTLTEALYAPFRELSRVVKSAFDKVPTWKRSHVPTCQRANDDHIWALKDVSFEVKHGEVIGIPSPASTLSALEVRAAEVLRASIGQNGVSHETKTATACGTYSDEERRLDRRTF